MPTIKLHYIHSVNKYSLRLPSLYKEGIHRIWHIHGTVMILITPESYFSKEFLLNQSFFSQSGQSSGTEVCLPISSEKHLMSTWTLGKRMKSLCSLLDTLSKKADNIWLTQMTQKFIRFGVYLPTKPRGRHEHSFITKAYVHAFSLHQ